MRYSWKRHSASEERTLIMSELKAKTDFFKVIAEMVTDGAYEYAPEEDICTIYNIVDDKFVPVSEIKNFKTVFYENTDESSHKILDEMFESIDARMEKASFEIKMKKGYFGKNPGWVICYLKYQAENDLYIGFTKGIDERVNENLNL